MAEERWRIFEVRKFDPIDALMFGFRCSVKGCPVPALYDVALMSGKYGERGKGVFLCPMHFQELQRRLPISDSELDLFLNHNLIDGCGAWLWKDC